MVDRYHQLLLPPFPDPMATALTLVRDAAGRRDYLLYEASGCWSFVEGAVAEIVVDRDGARWCDAAGTPVSKRAHPFRQVAKLLAQSRMQAWRAYGWISFDIDPPAPSDIPCGTVMHLVIPAVEVHCGQRRTLIRAADRNRIQQIEMLLAGGDSFTAPTELGTPIDGYDESAEEYLDQVARAQQYIATTGLTKAIVSRRLDLAVAPDLPATYAAARPYQTPARSFLFDLGGLEAAGFSPETVLEVRGRRLTTTILAGTAPAGTDEQSRAVLGARLLQDPKEVFEHAVSVVEGLSEMEAISAPGTSAVSAFMQLVRRGAVQHLASTLTGRLRQGMNGWEALCHVYPGSAATGVPRRAAREAIAHFESVPRGLYGGAVFACDHTGDLDVALALRCVVAKNGKAHLQAGAGITAYSVPDRELEETRAKLRTIGLHLVPRAAPRLEGK